MAAAMAATIAAAIAAASDAPMAAAMFARKAIKSKEFSQNLKKSIRQKRKSFKAEENQSKFKEIN